MWWSPSILLPATFSSSPPPILLLLCLIHVYGSFYVGACNWFLVGIHDLLLSIFCYMLCSMWYVSLVTLPLSIVLRHRLGFNAYTVQFFQYYSSCSELWGWSSIFVNFVNFHWDSFQLFGETYPLYTCLWGFYLDGGIRTTMVSQILTNSSVMAMFKFTFVFVFVSCSLILFSFFSRLLPIYIYI